MDSGVSRYQAFKIDNFASVYTKARDQFNADLQQIIGAANCRLIITPHRSDTTTTTDLSPNARTVTWDATIAAQLDQAGLGESVSFDGSSDVGLVADQANLSFGDGSVDSPFSVVAVVNVTNTALYREIITKYSTVNGREWGLQITNGDALELFVFDHSASTPGANPNRVSNAAITQGAVQMFAGTYSAATGGATAGNDMKVYVADAEVASTARNEVAYVAMENTNAPVVVGAIQTGTYDQWFQGSFLLAIVVAGVLTTAQLTSIKNLVNAYFGLSL